MTTLAQYGLLRVVLPVPLRREFDYLCPLPLPARGCRVRVPFGNRTLVALVLDHPTASEVPPDKLKPLDSVLDEEPVLADADLRLLAWATGYYLHAPGEVYFQALPTLLRKGETAGYRSMDYWHLLEPDARVSAQAVKQQQALTLLRQGPLTSGELDARGIGSPILQALARKGVIEKREQLPARDDWRPALAINQDDKPRLGREQALAVSLLHQAEGFVPFLLEGITGSGKTEVYLQAMEPVLAAGRQVLVLVPEIGLTPQTIARFQRRFRAPVSTLHSGMSERERLDTWLACRDGGTAILIGTRSALLTPFRQLGLIIIDEEHDTSFKQQDGFRYHARDLALLRARQLDIPILLGSATPSFESLHNAATGKYRHLILSQRPGTATVARHLLLDSKHVQLQAGLSPQLLQLMEQELAQGNQVMLFLNRRGYAPALLCHDCGWLADCERCDAHYTWHRQQSRLHCHHCDHQRPLPPRCPQCGSQQLMGTGLGTEQVEQALAGLFPQYASIRIDRDNTRRKGSFQQHLDGIRAGRYQILIGTQMLAKGHHFPDVTLVAMLDVDGALFASDFRATERFAQLYIQVAGRAGRASKPGRVVLQSHHPEHALLQDLANQGYRHFAQGALRERQAAALPPFSFQALFRVQATRAQYCQEFLQQLAGQLAPGLSPGVLCLGPMSAQMERKAGQYRYQLLLQAASRRELAGACRQALALIETLASARKVRWSLDIDPVELW
ncbi:primosomal protein N' [Zobellella denitrificans]|uniref:Replication restart protein PriA n=1 Tax=Zobellella denitrificans TaxID=347534 RepID=A0A291HK39_9GAMM|nr:primosomal protein N' [Zobellella denitrificans]ATG72596.1 primosomal protein N' [Zobellella denitrificans]